MGNNNTPTDMRGFVVPWPFNSDYLWSSESTFNQQGPRSGVAEAQGNYDLVIKSTGDMQQNADITVQTQKAGHVGKSKFVWKHASDTLFYGRDGGNVLSYWEIVEASTSSTDTKDISAALGLPSGEALALVRRRLVGTNYQLSVLRRSSSGTYQTINIISQTNSKPMHGGFCLLPDNSILLAHYVADTTTNRAQVVVHRSTNGGIGWTQISTEALPDFIDISGSFGAGNAGFDLSRLRIAYAQGQVLLMAGLRKHDTSTSATDIIKQYASTDNGGSFTLVADTDGGTGFFSFDILVKNDLFYLTFIDTQTRARILPLSHAFVSIDIVRSYGTTFNIIGSGAINIATLGSDKFFTAGQMSCWTDEDGRFFASIEDLDHNLMTIAISDDTENFFFLAGNGTNTTNLEDGRWYAIGSANTMITAHAGCSANGRQVVYHNFELQGSTTTYSASLCAAYLGGYSGVTMPQISSYPQSYDYAGWQFTWLPFDLPDDTGHYITSGAGTATLGSGKITITSATLQDKFYQSPNYSANTPIIIRARLKPLGSQGSITGGRGFEYRSGTYHVAVYIDQNQLALYDVHASAQIGSVFSFTANSEIDILFGMDDSNVYLWAMVASKIEKQWVLVANSTTVSAGSGIANARVRFGVISALVMHGGASLETEWYEFHYSNDTFTGDGLHNGQINPTQLKGRLYPPVTQFAYLTNGTRITTIDGPAYELEQYRIQTAYEHPIDRVFYKASPSPKTQWRSIAVSSGALAEQKIALYMDTTIANADGAMFGNDLFGITLTNINFKDFDLHRYDAAGSAWVSLGTFSNHMHTGTFLRIGPTIISNDATGPYLQFDECRDWYAILTSGETSIVRKIRTNSEGVFNNASANKRAMLQLADVEASDLASGTIHIVPNACTVLVDLQQNSPAALRITLKSQKTNENYFAIGNLCIGPVVIPAHQYGRGRTIEFDSQVETDIANDGTQRTTNRNAGGRSYRIAWAEGVDIQDIYEDPASPDFYMFNTGATHRPVASVGSAPTAMMGVIKYLQGPENAIVYLPQITPVTGGTTSRLLNRRMQHALVTLQSPVTIENVLGDELRDEVMRVGTIQLREVR